MTIHKQHIMQFGISSDIKCWISESDTLSRFEPSLNVFQGCRILSFDFVTFKYEKSCSSVKVG